MDATVITTSSSTTTTAPPSVPISSRFPATTSDGYAFSLDVKVALTGAILDIANAKPGQGHVIPQATGHLTITNTTPSRNAALSFTLSPQIGLLWPKDELEARFGKQPCLFEFKGVVYCFLVTLRFDLPNRQTGKASLGVGESVTLPLLDAGATGSFDSHAEPIARWAVDQLNSHQRPKLVVVTADSNLLRSCSAGLGARPIAILGGDGTALLAQGHSGFFLPNCKDL